MNHYTTKGVCCKEIQFEVEGEVIKNVRFESGCNGNLKGLSSLVDGMKLDDVIRKIKGTTCGKRKTSCPDQLAIALENWKLQQNNKKDVSI